MGGRGRHRCDGACVSRQRGSERPPPGRTGPDRADCSRRAARSTEVSVVVLMRLIRRLFTASCCRPDDCRPPGTKPRQSRAAGAPTGYKRAQLRQGVCLGRVLSLSTCGPATALRLMVSSSNRNRDAAVYVFSSKFTYASDI